MDKIGQITNRMVITKFMKLFKKFCAEYEAAMVIAKMKSTMKASKKRYKLNLSKLIQKDKEEKTEEKGTNLFLTGKKA